MYWGDVVRSCGLEDVDVSHDTRSFLFLFNDSLTALHPELKDTIAYLVEALCYKPEGRGFDSGWGHWIFQLSSFLQPHYDPEVDSASNRNE
jgi:hypothetical protein